jgi:hypothetical protein
VVTKVLLPFWEDFPHDLVEREGRGAIAEGRKGDVLFESYDPNWERHGAEYKKCRLTLAREFSLFLRFYPFFF